MSYDLRLHRVHRCSHRVGSKSNDVVSAEHSMQIDHCRHSSANRTYFDVYIGMLTCILYPQSLCRYFVWIMTNQSKRCVEFVLEGVPTQDMLVQMERAADATEVERFAESIDDRQHDRSQSTSQLQSLDDLKLLARRLSSSPNEHAFRSIVHRLLIGEQLIVVAESTSLVERILFAFANLLPHGCVRMTTYSDEYLYLYR